MLLEPSPRLMQRAHDGCKPMHASSGCPSWVQVGLSMQPCPAWCDRHTRQPLLFQIAMKYSISMQQQCSSIANIMPQRP